MSDGVSDEQKEVVIRNDLKEKRFASFGACDGCDISEKLYRVGPSRLCERCFEAECNSTARGWAP